MKLFLFLCSLFLFGNAQAGELYRSIDGKGNVHYGDTPLEDSDDVVQLKFGGEPAPDEIVPYATYKARQNFPVTLYVFPNCGTSCQLALDLLNKRGVPYAEINLVSQVEIDAFRKASGGIEVPALTVGKAWLKGFLAEQWNKELDFAGYPRTSPYRPRPTTPPVPPAQ
jgi:glutaredoxin